MFDTLIKGGLIIDGTGAPGRHRDIGVSQGRIAEIGDLGSAPAARRIDALGLVVTPGFIDIHTHYDAQLHWDGYATPSSLHGITTVFGGNCGFSLAPLKDRDSDYTRRMMMQVEGMPLAALERGLGWDWETFGQFLDRLEGRIGVNAGFLVGHCALRRYVLGAESLERASTGDEVRSIAALLHESLQAGGLGLSTTRSSTHPDHDGRPVPSRVATVDELLQLCDVVGEHPGTTLEAIVSGCMNQFDESEVELLVTMSVRANRPINWNLLRSETLDAGGIEHQMSPSVRARSQGGRVVALTLPVIADLNMSLGSYCALWIIPGWRDVLTLPFEEKVGSLKDPGVRSRMIASAQGSGFERLADFGSYRIGDTVAAENRRYQDRIVADIAREKGSDSWNVLVDIAAADDFKTVLWPLPDSDDAAAWDVRRALWDREDVVLGGSDAGAHLDRVLGSSYPTRFLADTMRGRKLVSLERAVQLMSEVPARLYGLKDRGRIVEGGYADLVVLDPDTVDSGPARRVYDLPGDSMRLTAESIGVVSVLVDGVRTIADGQPTGALPGRVLRSGRDTETVSTRT